jgi:peptide methionine sulfoxide reductase MsrA
MATMWQLRDFRTEKRFSADYHQQYLAKNPDGYCPNHSCGIPYKSAVLYSGEKA